MSKKYISTHYSIPPVITPLEGKKKAAQKNELTSLQNQ